MLDSLSLALGQYTSVTVTGRATRCGSPGRNLT